MDVRGNGSYPANKLSNFAGHRFVIDGVMCNSMEGFLQALKFSNPDMQEEVCTLVGFAAKKKGKDKNWRRRQVLHWRGVEIKRDSQTYQDLLDRAYEAMASQSEGFRKALLASGTGLLTHSIGRRKKNETVLTTNEFCSRLMKLRERIRNGEL
jgi:predicted NAD-dependent protein-ADP-ribosyltransferase YbiA (DUF1768 family)